MSTNLEALLYSFCQYLLTTHLAWRFCLWTHQFLMGPETPMHWLLSPYDQIVDITCESGQILVHQRVLPLAHKLMISCMAFSPELLLPDLASKVITEGIENYSVGTYSVGEKLCVFGSFSFRAMLLLHVLMIKSDCYNCDQTEETVWDWYR